MPQEMVLLMATSFAVETLAQAIASTQTDALSIIARRHRDHTTDCLHRDAFIVKGCSQAAEQYCCLQGSKLGLQSQLVLLLCL